MNHREETADASSLGAVTPERRQYKLSPLVSATRRLTKAQKALDRAREALDRQVDAQAAYDAAVVEYEAAAAEMRLLVE